VKLQTALSASLAEEVPVALVFNGISHAVMMATPLQLEDFALGFALSEGLIDLASHMYGVEVIEQEQGIELHIDIASQCEVRLKERKRSMAGRTDVAYAALTVWRKSSCRCPKHQRFIWTYKPCNAHTLVCVPCNP